MKKINLSSIKYKIIFYFSILLAIGCISFGATSYFISSRALNNTVNLILPQLSNQTSKLVDQKIKTKLKNLETLANIPLIKNEKASITEKMNLLKEEAKINNDLRIGIVDINGNVIYTDGNKINIGEKENIVKALKGEENVTDPLKSEVDGKVEVMCTFPIKSNGKVIGAITSVTDMKEFNKLMEQIKIGNSNSSFIVDKNGVTIADKDMTVVNNQISYMKKAEKDSKFKSVGKAVKKMISKKEGTSEYNYEGVDKVMAFSSIKSTGWVVAAVITKKEVLLQLNVLVKSIIIASIIALIVGVVFTRFISHKMSKGIENGVEYIEKASSGDLRFDISKKHLESKDEIGKMARSINEMKSSVGGMIDSIKDTSKNIENQSDGLYNASNEMTTSCENVTLSIQEVAKGTQNQAQELSQITDILNQFGYSIEEASKSVEDIEEGTKGIKGTADESNEHMNQLIISVKNVKNTFNDLIEKTVAVETNVDKINEITDLINSIAQQTNLLALNAAIEAARAGESGRGFAVVAEEIRKLAEESRNSSENIASIVSNVVTDTGNMSNNTKEVKKTLEKQESMIDITLKSFEKITNAVDDIMPKVKKTTDATLKIDKDKVDIIKKIENISAVSEEVSASSEEISASSEEMTSISMEVEETAKKLNVMTKDMKDKVEIFNV
ncbi:methyl-accepting chemotaxis protein [Clostridium oceanicum]|uniref:Methyl-accepting chemotaxis protein n=1 Tax=Clostridium oceanicum TaxID=1543 RepID=A0ABP3UK52_9CLOT